ncbi:oxysterol-binding protein-like protein [Melanomma pulvis-pyrius CBS 109.77]|uniref:Oxysterol-binding protein-like protein n=1 Tax=Melanomma pulvis-pyrius CBS 109.77 TaxID=1314802 RepID=A0A6A6XAS8_9PLEO|nr:oxysterol-binding protein-like protein [Melanomma pulvis-pyrius CBS 109.77]
MAENATPPTLAAADAPPSLSAAASTEPSRATTPANAPVERPPDDGSKLKTFLGVLRRFIGVADLAAVRFSLPAQLLEPTPNLEYWHYLDRPEAFISIGDSDEPLGRMLGTLRFWFTKDLKYVKGKPCKPYNSTLGEFFRCNWQVEDTSPPIKHASNSAPSSGAASASGDKFVKVSYLTEQTSHHPPVSAFFIDCPEKGITARGFDQLSAKFTGTSIRVIAGAHNMGIFISLQNRDNEEYQLTHPAAYLGGLLRGSLSVSVADSCYVTCSKTKIKVILQYLEEGWLGRTQNKVEGVIFTYDPDNDTKTKIKEVPDKDVLARIEGCWQDKIYYTLGSQPFNKAPEKILLLDLNPLFPVPKTVPPIEEQLPNESRKFWEGVTNAIVNKQYSLATTLKQEIEEKQRARATERKAENRDWQPRFFTGALTPVGKPALTKDGEEALKGLREDNFLLEPNKELGA